MRKGHCLQSNQNGSAKFICELKYGSNVMLTGYAEFCSGIAYGPSPIYDFIDHVIVLHILRLPPPHLGSSLYAKMFQAGVL